MAEELWQQYQVPYQEAARSLDEQLTRIDSIQTRTGTLIAAAAIVTSFLGGQVLTKHDPDGWTWIALAAFAGVLLLALLVVRYPKPVTAAKPTELIPLYIEREAPVEPEAEALSPLSLMYRDVSLYMERTHETNTAVVAHLGRLFDGAATLLGIEIVAWVIQLA